MGIDTKNTKGKGKKKNIIKPKDNIVMEQILMNTLEQKKTIMNMELNQLNNMSCYIIERKKELLKREWDEVICLEEFTKERKRILVNNITVKQIIKENILFNQEDNFVDSLDLMMNDEDIFEEEMLKVDDFYLDNIPLICDESIPQ